MITLVVALLVVAPFVVLALRTTRWDPIDRRRGRAASRSADAVSFVGPVAVDLRRADTDLAAASAHAAA